VRASAAARRYARALFSIARDSDDVDTARSELTAMHDLFAAERELRNALFRPLHPVKERRAVLDAVCQRLGVSETVRRFLVYLIDQRRLVDFEGIRAHYDQLADEAAGLVQAEVVAAGPLGEAQQERLKRVLAARTGHRVELSVRVDPDLIAGAVARVGNLVFDGSLRTQLAQLRDTLLSGRRRQAAST